MFPPKLRSHINLVLAMREARTRSAAGARGRGSQRRADGRQVPVVVIVLLLPTTTTTTTTTTTCVVVIVRGGAARVHAASRLRLLRRQTRLELRVRREVRGRRRLGRSNTGSQSGFNREYAVIFSVEFIRVPSVQVSKSRSKIRSSKRPPAPPPPPPTPRAATRGKREEPILCCVKSPYGVRPLPPSDCTQGALTTPIEF
jgi:hypothetical protein